MYSGIGVYDSATGNLISSVVESGTVTDNDAADNEFSFPETIDATTASVGSVLYLGPLDLGAPTGEVPVAQFTAGPDVGNYVVFFPPGESVAASIDALSVGVGVSFTVCFASGTEIRTPDGFSLVEDLKIGDTILTSDGLHTPVKWIGRQTVHKLFSGAHMQPVRIRAGALGDNLPHSDLTVTADHGMVIDDYVINASALVNGDTIDYLPMDELPDEVTYYHVETENHDVILANGAPAETFVDAVTRSRFNNYQEYLDLYGAERIIPEMDRPRISSARLVPESVKERVFSTEAPARRLG